MAKETGLGMVVIIDDSGGSARTISNDITNLDISIPKAVQDITGVDKSAIERLQTLADYSITLNGIFNDASNSSHDVFKTVGSASVARTTSTAISGQTLAVEAFFTDYALSRPATGELTWSAPGVLQNGAVPTWA